MKLSSIIPLAGSLTVVAQSLKATSSLSSSTSSPSKAVPSANYDGLWRPQVHFSPPVGFMNDPNGLFVDSEGVYHQYYQYNPYDTVAGNQTWGHATSTDLYRWEVQPVALAPTHGTDLVFSGSAVVDSNNTSGFFPNQTNGVVAIFTTSGPTEQVQDIAYSIDNGYTFTRYANNPILRIGSANFRDPKVIWHDPTSRWVMVISFAQAFTVGVYTSQNLRDWTFASNYTYHGLIGYQYECPNLVQMPMEGQEEPMWLMYVSINPGAPYGGSIGQLFGGDNFFFMDRGNLVGFEDPFFTNKFSQSFLFGDAYDMQLVIDRSLVEAFILRGEKSATLSIFPQAALDTITVSTFGINPGAKVSIAIWELDSAWKPRQDSDGFVSNNSTAARLVRHFKA